MGLIGVQITGWALLWVPLRSLWWRISQGIILGCQWQDPKMVTDCFSFNSTSEFKGITLASVSYSQLTPARKPPWLWVFEDDERWAPPADPLGTHKDSQVHMQLWDESQCSCCGCLCFSFYQSTSGWLLIARLFWGNICSSLQYPNDTCCMSQHLSPQISLWFFGNNGLDFYAKEIV